MQSANIRLFSSDLDGTLLGDPMSTLRFTEAWSASDPRRRPLLVYNTSRSVNDARALVAARHLPEPDFILGGLGTELLDSLYNRSAEFRGQFNEGWDLMKVEAIVGAIPGIKRHAAENSHSYKSSWVWPGARRDQIDQLRGNLQSAGLQANLVYSCLHFLDVLPGRASKGRGLSWLCRRLGVPLNHVLVAGDTANDASMFLLPDVSGILVANALPELCAKTSGCRLYAAQADMADGVLEGLRYFGVIPAEQNAELDAV